MVQRSYCLLLVGLALGLGATVVGVPHRLKRGLPYPFNVKLGHFANTELKLNPMVHMPVFDMVTSKGYPFDQHSVTTIDGYVLGVHRIPFGVKSPWNAGTTRPVMLLQHGLLSSSVDWLVNSANESLGYLFADAGFDVWLGNFRGNKFSRVHLKYDTDSNKFWDFSWQEMAEYDLPATIDYILRVTGQKKLYIVGHSEGTLVPFATLSQRKQYADKVEVLFALAPVYRARHTKGLVRILAYWSDNLQELFNILGMREFLPRTVLNEILSETLCKFGGDFKLCDMAFYYITGMDHYHLNSSRLPVYLGHAPAGTSVKNMVHFSQMIRNDDCMMYDYGDSASNRKRYGQRSPPRLEIERMRTPVAVFWGGRDWFAAPQDVKYLLPKLGRNLISQTWLPDMDHIDFVWGQDCGPPIYKKIIELVAQFPIK